MNFFKKQYQKVYYSQLGEDIMLYHILIWLDIQSPSYLDIGCSHPVSLNNTYLLYKKGITGTLIEPDTSFNKNIKKHRPKDKLLNIGISAEEGSKTFYILKNKTLNTFDPNTFNHNMSMVEKVVDIPTKRLNAVMSSLHEKPNLINLDIEGLQLHVLRDYNFDIHKPEIFCIETQDDNYNKIPEIHAVMEANGYFSCADTFINTIFVLKEAWEKRPR